MTGYPVTTIYWQWDKPNLVRRVWLNTWDRDEGELCGNADFEEVERVAKFLLLPLVESPKE